MTMKKPLIRLVFLLSTLGVLSQFFLNCSGMGFNNTFISDSNFSSMDSLQIPLGEHMATANLPVNNNYLVPRSYAVSLLTDIFTSPNFPVKVLTQTLREFILNKPGSFGGNCDLTSSESGNDCGGDISNSALPPMAPASTIRAVSLSATCENILSDDNAVNAVLEKLNHHVAPDGNSIGQIYSLFRRGWEPDPNYVATLVQMDNDLVSSGSSNIDRWRLQILTICEDPVWQSL